MQQHWSIVVTSRHLVTAITAGLMLWPSIARTAPAAYSPAHAESVNSTPSASLRGFKLPERWLPSRGRECARTGRYRGFCQGPRRVPAPQGPEAELAARIGLGSVKTVSHLLLKAPKPEWIAAAKVASGLPLLWPVPDGKLWRGMSRAVRAKDASGVQRIVKRRHKGLDIGAPEGSLIRAAQSGIVAYADNEVRGYGNLLVIVHPDGSATFYGHCRAIYLFPGQLVTRGQLVGEVGQTGIARGAHLHFEYRRGGRLRDPLKSFVERPPDSFTR